jgi:hypothetical protein
MAPAHDTRGRFVRGQSGNPRGRARGSKNRPRHLSLTEAMTAAQLARKGHAPRTIAKLLQARPEAVKEALTQARQLLEYFAPEVAMDWINASRVAAAHGDHKPAMALLQSVKVVDPPAQKYDTGQGDKASAVVNVQFVGFQFAGLPSPTTAPAGTVEALTP